MRIAWIIAHPDDESFSSACTIYEAAVRGHQVSCLLATWGDAGKTGYLGPMTKQELALQRRKEMQQAAGILKIRIIEGLGYPDGQVNALDRSVLVNDIVEFIQRHQIEIVVTFPSDGVSGHLDHIAVHHATNQAILSGRCPSVRKLYYFASTIMLEAGHKPSVHIDSTTHWDKKKAALLAHESQRLSVERVFGNLEAPPEFFRMESFILAWEEGSIFPVKQEVFLTDSIAET